MNKQEGIKYMEEERNLYKKALITCPRSAVEDYQQRIATLDAKIKQAMDDPNTMVKCAGRPRRPQLFEQDKPACFMTWTDHAECALHPETCGKSYTGGAN